MKYLTFLMVMFSFNTFAGTSVDLNPSAKPENQIRLNPNKAYSYGVVQGFDETHVMVKVSRWILKVPVGNVVRISSSKNLTQNEQVLIQVNNMKELMEGSKIVKKEKS